MRSNSEAALSLFLLAMALPAEAATFTVGNSSLGCTHRRLEDAVAAAEANGPASDLIRINTSYSGSNTALSIVNHSVRLVGGHASCTSPSATSVSTLRAAAGSRVLTIAGAGSVFTTVNIENLTINNGAPADLGGGIAVFGRPTVTLRRSRISGNSAERGGGIYVDGLNLATPAQVIVDASSIESNSSSQKGAGIYCQGGSRITLRKSATVRNNGGSDSASLVDEGGGAYLEGCSWDQAGGSLSGNRARSSGAGLLAASGAQVLIDWGDASDGPVRPRLSSNRVGTDTSGGLGGAITARDPGTRVELFGALLDHNGGGGGTAIWVDDGAYLSMQRDPYCPGGSTGCSELLLNTAEDYFPASVVLVSDNSSASINQTTVHANSAGDAARAGSIFLIDNIGPSPGSLLSLHSTLIADNQARSLIWLDASHTLFEASEHVDAQFVTTANNDIESVLDALPRTTSEISLRASIIADDVPLHAFAAGPGDLFDCLLSAVPLGTTATRSLVSAPLIDSQYVPQPGSPALDFCSGQGLTLDRGDLRNGARVVNLISVPNQYGSADLGAIEKASDPLPTFTQ